MHLVLTKIQLAPPDTFVPAKVGPRQPLARRENMEIELDKLLKPRHAHMHAPQARTVYLEKLHVISVLQGRIAMVL